MLPALAFALLAAEPAVRFDAFMKAHPTFLATLAFSSGGRTVGKGALRVARPRLLRFDAQGKGFDFTLVSTPEAYIEVERTQKVYDERPSTGGFRAYESRISGASAFLPGFLLSGTSKGLFGGLKTTVTAVPGGDEIHATAQTQTGPVELRLVVAPEGRPVAYSEKGAGSDREWRVTAVEAGTADPAAYRLEPPLGYVPHALPDLPAPLAIGEPAPLVGWRKGGRPLDLHDPQRGRARLLAVLDPASPPSRAARPFLVELGRTMPVFLLGPGDITDPSGALMKRLSPPGVPMFYLVGPDDAVKKLWFGFDPARGKAWEAEVLEAAKAGAK